MPFSTSKIEYANKEVYLEAYEDFKRNYSHFPEDQIRMEWMIKHGIPFDFALKCAEDPKRFKEIMGLG